MPEIAPRLRQTEEYYFSRKLREIEQMNREGEKVINVGNGSPDLHPHPEVVEKLCHSAGQSNVHGSQSYRGAPMSSKPINDGSQGYLGDTLTPKRKYLPLTEHT